MSNCIDNVDMFRLCIKDYWGGNLTMRELRAKYGVNAEEGFAIAEYSKKLSFENLQGRIKNIKTGMTAQQIRMVMEE